MISLLLVVRFSSLRPVINFCAYYLSSILAGASGCVIASRLANSAARPSVLLLECGGANDHPKDLLAEERFNVAFNSESSLNWNYKTTPQHQLIGQEVDYSRGRGLGGTTAINFCAWTVGPKDDYDEWARRVGDESFGWRNVQRCLKRIENLHPEIPQTRMRRFLDAKIEGMRLPVTQFFADLEKLLILIEDHSSSGPLHLTYGDSWSPELIDLYVAAEQSGLGINKDINSGNPLGEPHSFIRLSVQWY
jgi:choline dehydrogenase-like flavoprotein